MQITIVGRSGRLTNYSTEELNRDAKRIARDAIKKGSLIGAQRLPWSLTFDEGSGQTTLCCPLQLPDGRIVGHHCAI